MARTAKDERRDEARVGMSGIIGGSGCRVGAVRRETVVDRLKYGRLARENGVEIAVGEEGERYERRKKTE